MRVSEPVASARTARSGGVQRSGCDGVRQRRRASAGGGRGKERLIDTGRNRFRFYPTPHSPHGWDAGILFEETNRTLLCSDLFHHTGDVEPCTESDVVGRTADAMRTMQQGPLMDYMQWTPRTGARLRELAALEPRLCATMHGSAYRGDGAKALHELSSAMESVLG